MTSPSHIAHTLRHHATDRYQRFADSSFGDLLTLNPAFRDISDQQLDFYKHHAADIQRCLSTDSSCRAHFLDFFQQHTLNFVHSKNQFIVVNAAHKRDLLDIYQQFLGGFQRTMRYSGDQEALRIELEAMMMQHQRTLSAFVQDLGQGNGSMDFILTEPVCGGYSAALQLRALNMMIEQLNEPVLDVGCGQNAPLVSALREQGIVAYGIDRMAQTGDFALHADWFDFAPGDQQWGTILSHMAFSLQFLHHHYRQDGHPEQYARYYMRLLHALKPGGTFAYTPGLPFIESLLPRDQFIVETLPLTNQADLMGELSEEAGFIDALYTAHITRL